MGIETKFFFMQRRVIDVGKIELMACMTREVDGVRIVMRWMALFWIISRISIVQASQLTSGPALGLLIERFQMQ